MKNLFPVLCFILVGMFYVGCSEDYITESSGDMEHAVVDGSQGEGLVANKKPGSGGGGATYNVVLDIPGIGVGTSTAIPGKDSGRTASVGDDPMEFTFTDPLCPEIGSDVSGLFALVLKQSKHPPNPLWFTWASVSFFNFTGADGRTYHIEFNVSPDDFTLEEWLPSGSEPAVHEGTGFELSIPRRSSCDSGTSFNQTDWTLTVTANQ